MEVLSLIFQSLLDLGASVFLPIVLIFIGIIVGLKPSKAFSAALTLGVAFVGINLIISFMGDTVGVAAQDFVSNSGIQLTALDMGWAPALGLAWQWQYAFFMFPVQIIINLIMIATGTTDTLNVDMWNVGNKVFTAFLITTVTGNVIIGFVVGIIQIIFELKNSDYTKYQIRELTGIPGVGMPHPMFLSNIIFYPISKALDKVLPSNTNWNAATIKNKIGVFGENHVLGFVIGTIIGLAAGYRQEALLLGVQAGTALTLFPMVSKLFMTALTPISDSANTFMRKRFPNKDLVIGLDWPILAGNPEIWVAIILTIPVALVMALVLPGNSVLPFGNLMNVCVCAAAFLSCKGNLLKMTIISYLWVPILLWSATAIAPKMTDLAIQAGTTLAAGQITWWGMDIAEIRWALFEAGSGNILGMVAVAGVGLLAIPYFKNMKKEEKAARIRMGLESPEEALTEMEMQAK